MKRSMKVPKPFLGPIFEPEAKVTHLAGFLYEQGERELYGVPHGANDYAAEYDTPVLLAADGYAVRSYGTFLVRNPDGTPRLLGRDDIGSLALPELPAAYPEGKGPWPVWYGSYLVQVWHPGIGYTQYAHLSWAREDIPWYAPKPIGDDGDLAHNPILRARVRAYADRREPRIHGTLSSTRRAIFLKAGTVLGGVGTAGMSWGRVGERDIDLAPKDTRGAPEFRGRRFPSIDTPHLHLAVMGPRAAGTRKPPLWDPHGLYADRPQYPATRGDWHRDRTGMRHRSLFLPQL